MSSPGGQAPGSDPAAAGGSGGAMPAPPQAATPGADPASPRSLATSLSRVARSSVDVAATRTRSLARASLRAIGLERLAAHGGGDRGLGLADRRVLQVGLEEWRDDAALRAAAGSDHGDHGGGGGGGGGGGPVHKTPPGAPGSADAAGAAKPPPPRTPRFFSRRNLGMAYLTIGCLYGDLATSPLYCMSATFPNQPPGRDEVSGALSIIFWTLTLVLIVKYTFILLRADDAGQGGTFALYALLRRQGEEAGADKATEGLGPSVYTRGPVLKPSPPLGGARTFARASLSMGAGLRRRGGGAVGSSPDLERSSAPVGGAARSKGPPPSGLEPVPAGVAVAFEKPSPFQAAETPTPADAEAGRAGPRKSPPLHKDWRQRFIESARTQTVLRVLVAIGVGAILSDGVLTPAISIVSAAEGLSTAFPSLPKDGGVVLGVAVGILVCLFTFQQFGTGAVSAAFSPVGLAWLATLVGLGTFNLVKHATPSVFASLSPHHAYRFFARDGAAAWRSLGSLALAITGAEALYADLGHFNRPSIQIASLSIVYPALVTSYLGQASLLMARPEVHANVFWASVPKPVFWPVWVIATLAAVVASQALISAAFAIVSQAVRQRFVPRLRIVHTSRSHAGQIYIPAVNWLLAILAIAVVAGFRSSEKLGNAYGIAVLLDMLLSTSLCSLVMLTVWKVSLAVVVPFFLFFFTLEAAYWSATLLKVPHGGWYPLMMAALFSSVELVWFWGAARRMESLARQSPQLDTLLAAHGGPNDALTSLTVRGPPIALLAPAGAKRLTRTRGVALYLTDVPSGAGEDRAPPVLAHQLARLPVLYEANAFVTIRTVPVPEVPPASRFLVASAGVPGFYHVVARFGYMETARLNLAFADALLDHTLDLLYAQLAVAAKAEPALRTALDLPEDFAEVAAAAASARAATARSTSLASAGSSGGGGASPAVRLSPFQRASAPARAGPSPAPTTPALTPTQARERELRASLSRAVSRTLSTRQPDAPGAQLGSARRAPGAGSPMPTVAEPTTAAAAAAASLPLSLASLTQRADALLAETAVIEHARAQGAVIFICGDSVPITPPGTNFLKKLFLAGPFSMLVAAGQEPAASALGIPSQDLLGIVLPYDL